MSETVEQGTPAAGPISDDQFKTYFESGGEKAPEAPKPTDTPAPATKAPEPAKPAGEHVPLATLLEERRARQQLANDMKVLQAKLDALTAPKPKTEEIPEFGQDPEKYIAGNLKAVQTELATLKQAQEKRAQAEQHQAAYNQLTQAVAADEQRMVKEAPDYFDAMSHLRDVQFARYRANGVPEQQLAQAWANDVATVAARAMQAGRSPAQVGYDMAKASGYQKKAAADPDSSDENVLDADTEKLLRIAEGQKLGASASGGGSGGTKRGVSASDLARMSPEQFAKYEEAHPEAVRRAMGG